MNWRRTGATLMVCAVTVMAPATAAHADATPTPVPSASTAAPESVPAPPSPDASTAAPAVPAEATPAPTPTATTPTTATTKPAKRPKQPRRKLPLRKGDFGPLISKAQQRLTWLGYEITPATLQNWLYGDTTAAAVKKFQVKFFLKPTGTIDKTTWKKLSSISGPIGKLPKACTEVTAICADKTQKVVRYVVKGRVVMTTDARFGMPGTPTGEGTFRVHEKAFDHTSSKFHTWMPRAMFFNGGQAVHFSPYFLHDGYYGGSHGCINIRDMAKVTWLFNHVSMGTRVHVYWS